jgi:Putative prokaryotic signal transducing protein
VRWRSRKSPSSGEHPEGHRQVHLVKVAYARNLAEAELIQGLLRQEEIPSMLKRNGGFDVPDFLSAGARDVLVPVSQADRARELLA